MSVANSRGSRYLIEMGRARRRGPRLRLIPWMGMRASGVSSIFVVISMITAAGGMFIISNHISSSSLNGPWCSAWPSRTRKQARGGPTQARSTLSTTSQMGRAQCITPTAASPRDPGRTACSRKAKTTATTKGGEDTATTHILHPTVLDPWVPNITILSAISPRAVPVTLANIRPLPVPSKPTTFKGIWACSISSVENGNKPPAARLLLYNPTIQEDRVMDRPICLAPVFRIMGLRIDLILDHGECPGKEIRDHRACLGGELVMVIMMNLAEVIVGALLHLQGIGR